MDPLLSFTSKMMSDISSIEYFNSSETLYIILWTKFTKLVILIYLDYIPILCTQQLVYIHMMPSLGKMIHTGKTIFQIYSFPFWSAREASFEVFRRRAWRINNPTQRYFSVFKRLCNVFHSKDDHLKQGVSQRFL